MVAGGQVTKPLLYRVARMAAAAAMAVSLTACGDSDLHTAAVKVAGVGKVDLFWVDPSPKFTILLLTEQTPPPEKDELAGTLAWPDRLVIRIPHGAPAPKEDLHALVDRVLDAAGTVVKQESASAVPPLVIGVGTAAHTALAVAALRSVSLSGAVATDYCPATVAPPPACNDEDEDECRAATPVVIVPDQTRCKGAALASVRAQFADARSVVPENPGDPDLIPSITSQVLGHADNGDNQNDLDLPIVELPAAGSDQRLAIIYSGDGGWADIDRELGTLLSQQGIAVVGFDTLKYFWQQKDPETAAADLERIITHYTHAWGRPHAILIGYSFGADILPLLWTHLPQTARKKVDLVALLGLSDAATFEITVGGWIGVEPAETEPVAPALAQMDRVPILCVYGTKDEDDTCAHQTQPNLEKFPMPGDHHFDGRYDKIADAILARTKAAGPKRR
jgi:type IV secretory pathway VirJ component